jgi:cell division protein FtsI (penicillin-binding protein 3)
VIQRIGRAFARRSGKMGSAGEQGADWRVTLTRRIRVAVGCLVLWAACIESRLVYLQIIAHADLAERAVRQRQHIVKAPGKRGDVLDRRGRVLATSVDADSIYAVPSAIDDPSATATRLCQALGDCSNRELQVLGDRFGKHGQFAWARRQVSPDAARRVAALNLEGVGFVKESKRFYPNKELAAHLLGYVGVDNSGLNGVESAYDSRIRGRDGDVLVNTDARRHAFNRFGRPPTSGSSIELTIDQYLQHVAERELHTGVVENRAAGGSAIIMNPRTGEILAMANEPTFNPNVFGAAVEGDRRNRAVQDLYEPGSTFKLVTASAAIEENVMGIDALIDTSPGVIRVGSSEIHDTANHGVLSFSDVIADSSNVGAVKIGFKVGTERLSRYVQRYGFGHPVSPDFPGESPGIVWSADRWTDSALAHVAIGYQIAVTPLQMLTAVSSIANLGQYVEPRIVRALYRDNRRFVVEPRVVRRSVSADTAATLTGIMETVVEHGTAKAAQIPGFTIAGKTGTAAKLLNGRYSKSDYNASFVAFVPSRDPAIAIIVVMDLPHHQTLYYGGTVAAPVFKRIAEPALRYLGIAPTVNREPPVLIARRDEGSQVPGIFAEAPAPTVNLVTDEAAGTVPDLRGMSGRDAVRKLVTLGLSPHVTGDGVVVSQDPPPGAPFDESDVCRLLLDRGPSKSAAGAGRP